MLGLLNAKIHPLKVKPGLPSAKPDLQRVKLHLPTVVIDLQKVKIHVLNGVPPLRKGVMGIQKRHFDANESQASQFGELCVFSFDSDSKANSGFRSLKNEREQSGGSFGLFLHGKQARQNARQPLSACGIKFSEAREGSLPCLTQSLGY